MKNISEIITEEAKSKSQRRLFGMALAYKRGELNDDEASEEIIKLSKLPEKELEDYAKTKEKNLPEKVDESNTALEIEKLIGLNEGVVNKYLGNNTYIDSNKLIDFLSECDTQGKIDTILVMSGESDVSLDEKFKIRFKK